MEKNKKPDQYVQSLARALDIIEKLVELEDGLGVTELSNSLGLHKSTVYRLLATLNYRGYVKKDRNDKYKVGMKLLEIGSNVLENIDLRKEVKPYIRDIQRESGETVHLGILDDLEVIYIDKEETAATIRMHSRVGRRVPAHCTSLGKVLLAYSSPDILQRLLREEGLPEYTENTITDEKRFKKHLEDIKEKGYAGDNEEMEYGIRCIAGPIFDYQKEIVAAFSISGPATRITEERVSELAQLVKKYTGEISSSLGYR